MRSARGSSKGRGGGRRRLAGAARARPEEAGAARLRRGARPAALQREPAVRRAQGGEVMESNVRRPRAVYAVVPKPEGKDVWLRVGSAFENRDGSVSVLLDAVPVGGKLQIRDYQPRDAQAPREQPDQPGLV